MATDPDFGLSVVIPALDESESLPALLEEVATACGPLDLRWEVIVVDDGSTDGTDALITELGRTRPWLRLIRLRRNMGKSMALAAGFQWARGSKIVTLDGDGQDDPSEIPRLLAPLDAGAGLVSGWKRERNDPAAKRHASRLFNKVTAVASGLPLHDFNCGLKAYRADCARGIDLYGERHRYMPLLAVQQGWQVTEIQVNHRAREHGRSHYGAERYLRGMLDLVTVLFIGRYQYRPLHLFGGIGLVTMMLGILVCAYLTVVKISGEAIGERPLLLFGVLCIVVGIQLITLGLVGEMIAASRQDSTRTRGLAMSVERVVEGGVSVADQEHGTVVTPLLP
jgi:glycosyltransferase involved in cell wall biosynthesis